MIASRAFHAAWIGAIALGVVAASPPTAPPEGEMRQAAAARHADAVEAEHAFFHALNHDASKREGALRALQGAYLADPNDGATNLWLGMAHLWVVAEGGADHAESLGHTLLSRHFLRRAQRLLPDDGRIASWLTPVELLIAEIDGDRDAAAEADERLLAALHRDPTFHSVSIGITRWDNAAQSEAFGEGLAAMRSGLDAAPDDPSALNHPRWPYNVEGFTLAMADYELKAGNRRVAAVLLTSIRERPGYESWPHMAEVETRLETLNDRARLYADADTGNDPPFILGRASGVSCVVCHQGAGTPR